MTTYNDTGLTDGTTYFYRVRATNAVGDSAYSIEASATTFDCCPRRADRAHGHCDLQQPDQLILDGRSNETGYKIERKTGAGGTYSQIGRWVQMLRPIVTRDS